MGDEWRRAGAPPAPRPRPRPLHGSPSPSSAGRAESRRAVTREVWPRTRPAPGRAARPPAGCAVQRGRRGGPAGRPAVWRFAVLTSGRRAACLSWGAITSPALEKLEYEDVASPPQQCRARAPRRKPGGRDRVVACSSQPGARLGCTLSEFRAGLNCIARLGKQKQKQRHF